MSLKKRLMTMLDNDLMLNNALKWGQEPPVPRPAKRKQGIEGY